jgi:Na+-translocating ferredoxin:NAD+ oxidoreductase RnfD subunit
MTARTLTIGQGSYPLVLPNVRDPRLHVAAVIISVHVLGQVGLGFWVTVPQILAAILTCAIIEVAITFRQSKAFVWPASAMLTGSGVALILRVVGTPQGQPWSTVHLEVFAAVAGLSLLSKYVIRYRGSHVFNPSNIGLVVAFLVLGSTRAEPLDFWWAPVTNPAMLLSYAAIVGGGLLITRRLKLLVLATTYWLVLAAGLGLLAASGHSIVTRWSFAPVSGFEYWRVIVTSPEVLIFLFFMITDPKTVPAGRVGRVVFGALVAIVGVLFMAPQTDEFGTKLGLLAGLVTISAIRPLLERVLPAPGSAGDSVRALLGRLLPGFGTAPGADRPGGLRRAAGVAVAAVALLVLGTGIVLAGTPARGIAVGPASELLDRVPAQVDPASLPSVTVGQDVIDFDSTLAGSGINPVLVTLAQNLEYENQAMLRGDTTILQLVDHGDRLAEMTTAIGDAIASGRRTITRYTFDRVAVSLLIPFGKQDGFSLGFRSQGTRLDETYDASGALISSTSAPYDLVFAVRRATGARWLLVGVLPPS